MRIPDREECQDLADYNEGRSESVASRNEQWAFYRAERIRKGRPANRRLYCQFDITARKPVTSIVRDPILDLHAARRSARQVPEGAMRYGEIRVRALSPEAKLP